MKTSPSNVPFPAVAAVGLAIAAALAGSSHATSPGRNGRIAYMVADGSGHWQVWLANADLSRAKKVTRGRYDSGWAVWSPDGKRLAFDSDRADPTPNDAVHVNDVFVMEPDGTGVKEVDRLEGRERRRCLVTERIVDRLRRGPRKPQGIQRHLCHAGERSEGTKCHHSPASAERP